MNEIKFVFGRQELEIFSLLTGFSIIGLDYSDVAEIDDEKMQNKAQTILYFMDRKKYITVEEDVFEINPSFLELLKECDNQFPLLKMEITEKDTLVQHYNIYRGLNGFVVSERCLKKGITTLFRLEETRDVIRLLLERTKLAHKLKTQLDNVQFKLNKRQYFSFISYAKMANLNKAREVLSEAGMDATLASDFVAGFIEQKSFNVIDYYAQGELNEQLVMCNSSKQLWGIQVMDPVDESFNIFPIHEEDLNEVLIRWMTDSLVEERV